MMRFAESVRARLALGHTAVLAMLLFLSAGATYVLLARTMAGRTDQYLTETSDALGEALRAEYEEDSSDDVAATQALNAFRFHDLTFVVYDRSWRVVASTIATEQAPHQGEEREHGLDLSRLRELVRNTVLADSEQRFVSLDDEEGGYRAYLLPVRLGRKQYTTVAAHSLHGQAETLETVRAWYLIAIPLALLLAWGGGYMLARHSLRPAESMGRSAARISAANLRERLPVGNPRDELGQLATVLNALLARVHDALEQQRRFTADASHELRTPIAVLQSAADIALVRDDRSASDYRDAIVLMRRTTRRMTTIVDDLFLLARADSGEQQLRHNRVYLDEMIVDCIQTMSSLATPRDMTVRFECDPEPCAERDTGCEYLGDEQLLRRIILNLLDNAIKYSYSGTEVVVSLLAEPDGRVGGAGQSAAWRVTVADNGPGIPAADQPYIFDRFYRVDTARTYTEAPSETARCTQPDPTTVGEQGGAGLGLAISRWIAEAHGGELRLQSSTARGTRFVLTLPAVALN